MLGPEADECLGRDEAGDAAVAGIGTSPRGWPSQAYNKFDWFDCLLYMRRSLAEAGIIRWKAVDSWLLGLE